MKTKVILIINATIDYISEPTYNELKIKDVKIIQIARYQISFDYNGKAAKSWLDRFGADTYIFTQTILNF